ATASTTANTTELSMTSSASPHTGASTPTRPPSSRFPSDLAASPARGPLISSRTRARTAVAAGSPLQDPAYFSRQPRANIVPRTAKSVRRRRPRRSSPPEQCIPATS
ncbi:unnamed protein product, partial [Scytosiphon promiscuus]